MEGRNSTDRPSTEFVANANSTLKLNASTPDSPSQLGRASHDVQNGESYPAVDIVLQSDVSMLIRTSLGRF